MRLYLSLALRSSLTAGTGDMQIGLLSFGFKNFGTQDLPND